MADNTGPGSSKKGFKRCSSCGEQQPAAKRTCGNTNCCAVFPYKTKDTESLKTMGKTCITKQRLLMERRADILNMHHNCNVVILMQHKHGSGETLTCYGTEGAGVSFIGNKSSIATSEYSRMAKTLFKNFLKEYSEANSKTTESVSTTDSTPAASSPSFNLPTSSSVTKRTSSTNAPSTSSTQSTSNMSSVTNRTSSTNASSTSSTQSTSNTSSVTNRTSSTNAPSTSSTQSTSNTSSVTNSNASSANASELRSPTAPSDHADLQMVLYGHDGQWVAAGNVYPDRTTLHGHNIPTGHVCVLLTTSQGGIPAPVILGDPCENAVLERGKIFALPAKNIMVAKQTSNGEVHLNPFV